MDENTEKSEKQEQDQEVNQSSNWFTAPSGSQQDILANLLIDRLLYFTQRLNINSVNFCSDSEAIYVNSYIKSPFFNIVFSAGQDLSQDKIDKILNYYAKEQMPYSWNIIASKESSNLENVLTNKKLTKVALLSCMAINLEDKYDSKFKIKRALNEQELKNFFEIHQSLYGNPETTKEYYDNFKVETIQEKDLVKGYLVCNETGVVASGIITLQQEPENKKDQVAFIDIHFNQELDNQKPNLDTFKSILESLLNIAIDNKCTQAFFINNKSEGDIIGLLEEMGFEEIAILKAYMPQVQIASLYKNNK